MITVGYGVLARLSKGVVAMVFVAFAAQAQPVTVVALGDSLTAGDGLAQDEGFVPQLEAWLKDRGVSARVINGGVSGDTSAGGAARINWALTPEVNAVVVTLGGNDLLRGIPPEETRKHLSRILTELQNRDLPALLVGLPGPANFGPDYKAAFEANFETLAAEFQVPLEPNFLAAITDTLDPADTARLYLQPDGLHPNREGVSRIVDAIGPKVLQIVPQAAVE